MDVTRRLARLMSVQNPGTWTTPSQLALTEAIKEKHAYVALDYQEEAKKASETSQGEVHYELPDGR